LENSALCFLQFLTYYYYYYAAFDAPCVGHKDDETQAQTG